MSAPLGSLEDFLGEPVTQQLPVSFLAPLPSECTSPRSAAGGAPASRFATWRRGVAARWADARQRRIELKAKRDAEKGAPLQGEVATLKAELEALRNEMRMMRGEFNAKGASSNGSSVDDLDSSDDEVRAVRSHRLSTSGRAQRTTTDSGFDDDVFNAWSEPSGSARASSCASSAGLPQRAVLRDKALDPQQRSSATVVVRDSTDSDEEEAADSRGPPQRAVLRDKAHDPQQRSSATVVVRDSADSDEDEALDAVRSLDLTPRLMDHEKSDVSQTGFDDDRFYGWQSSRVLPTTGFTGGQP